MIKRHKIIAVMTLILLCLNVFCLNCACAYTDIAKSNLLLSSSAHNSSDNLQTSADDSTEDGCYGICSGHCCVSHHSYLLGESRIISVIRETEKFSYLNERFVSSAILQSIPKPPCSYSLI